MLLHILLFLSKISQSFVATCVYGSINLELDFHLIIQKITILQLILKSLPITLAILSSIFLTLYKRHNAKIEELLFTALLLTQHNERKVAFSCNENFLIWAVKFILDLWSTSACQLSKLNVPFPIFQLFLSLSNIFLKDFYHVTSTSGLSQLVLVNTGYGYIIHCSWPCVDFSTSFIAGYFCLLDVVNTDNMHTYLYTRVTLVDHHIDLSAEVKSYSTLCLYNKTIQSMKACLLTRLFDGARWEQCCEFCTSATLWFVYSKEDGRFQFELRKFEVNCSFMI